MISASAASHQGVRVKICGIRSELAARTAIYSGAKFLGFNFVPGSKRKISPAIAKQIIDQIKNQINLVGVFQNQKQEEINEVAEFLDLDFIQLHGDEDQEFVAGLKKPVIKVLQLDPEFNITETLREMNKYKAEYFLLDRKKQGRGKMLSLKHLSVISKEKKIFVAGGLTIDNVADVVRAVKPFGVDVTSGIETSGVEDMEKIKLFAGRAKNV